MAETKAAGSAADAPLFMRLVRDDDGVKWANILVMLAVTVVSGYLATKAQRAGSNPDSAREVRMKVARAQITVGSKLVRFGQRVEDAGWQAYDQARG